MDYGRVWSAKDVLTEIENFHEEVDAARLAGIRCLQNALVNRSMFDTREGPSNPGLNHQVVCIPGPLLETNDVVMKPMIVDVTKTSGRQRASSSSDA